MLMEHGFFILETLLAILILAVIINVSALVINLIDAALITHTKACAMITRD